MSPDDVSVTLMQRTIRTEAGETAARAAERQCVSRELHDTTSQLLVALNLQLEQLRRTCPATAEALLNEMAHVIQSIHKSIRKIRSGQSGEDEDGRAAQSEIARVFYSLAPPNG
jgi:signal transduction histidine kinase